MTAPRRNPDFAQQLRAQLEWVELHLSSHASLVGSDETDPGTMEWWASASVRAFPSEDEADHIEPWYKAEGTVLSTRTSDDSLEITIFECNGLTINLQHVDDVHDALDARSEDYAQFIPLFGDRDRFGFVTLQAELEDQIQSLGSHVVIIDRVQLAPAWRGLGGAGRLLTARLLRWICPNPRLVAVLPFPIDLDRALIKNDAVCEPALAQARRTWASLGFRPSTGRLWVLDPADGTHENAVTELENSLGVAIAARSSTS